MISPHSFNRYFLSILYVLGSMLSILHDNNQKMEAIIIISQKD